MLGIRLLKFGIALFAALLSVLTVFALAPYSRVMRTAALSTARTVRFATLLRGRDRRCSIGAVWEVGQEKSNPVKERIRQSSRVVATDGNLNLVATPAGDYWIPAPDVNTLTEELSEQET